MKRLAAAGYVILLLGMAQFIEGQTGRDLEQFISGAVIFVCGLFIILKTARNSHE